jgi:cyclic beta-1,2-glucan synthetase
MVPLITENLERLRSWRKPKHGNGQRDGAVKEQPLRGELYSIDQLQKHAQTLALSHELASGPSPDKLLPRLNENETILVETHALVSAAVAMNRRVSPAAEWLLDNFYLIEEQIRTARRHLPPAYSRELPRLANGPVAKYPRAYGIAIELITHGDGRVDATGLDSFIASYQSVVPLTLGELWAIPIVLRLALIENLRRVAVRVADGRRDRDSAHDWAERMLRMAEQNPTDLILVLADMARANPPMTSAFLAELTRHLRGQNPYFAFANSWLEHRICEQGVTIEQMVQAEGQAQATDQVSIGNSISSLRFLTSSDWRDFVEMHSIVDQTLRGDPAGIYAGMDFATRDRYRHGVEQIARRSRLSEYDVARRAIQLAEASAKDKPADRSAHVGYYLIDRGRPALERTTAMKSSARMVARRIGHRHPLFFYSLAVLMATGGVTWLFLAWAGHRGAGLVPLLLLAIPAAICVAHFSVGMINWMVTLLVTPRPLPRMDFRKGIPEEHRTVVAVPTMLTSPVGVADLLEGLEIRYLANRDDFLHFVLLTDFMDAAQETIPADDELLRLASEGIAQLNEKYAGDRSHIFFLLHRPRRWNPTEKVWMGYERKRGKLAELNALLRGRREAGVGQMPSQAKSPREKFSRIVGDVSALEGARYVIALDTDTQLPRDSAREMVGAIAHALNRPVCDPRKGRVVKGYGILQPRVSVSLPSAHRSLFVRLFAGEAGIDPYTRVVSDVYQDLFGEGSFIGKGIYDVEAFEQTCGGFPENAVLSHDLLEGAHARSALLSDVELYEEYPSRYPVDISRRHRWIRGDWQIARWLLPRVPGLDNKRVDNPISALSWWKILDNLRRSLVPVAMLALLLGAWLTATPQLAKATTIFVLAIVALIPFLSALAALIHKPTELPLLTHLRATTFGFLRQISQFLFALVVVPYDAFISIDAIVRTLVRVYWTRTKLLEWKTSSDAERSACESLAGFYRSMWIAPAIGGAALGILGVWRQDILPVAASLLALWVLSPLGAWWLSRPLGARPVRLSGGQREFLEKLSRRTWRYFETFVTIKDNWLPPDNFQEYPAPVIASRTSPTNIGMAMLANLAAYDFGYVSVGCLLDRTGSTFETLNRLERYRGHFFNWYDTRSLQPLPPRYVSMVDSGNLAGYLLVLRRGLEGLVDAGVAPSRIFGGLRDTLRILRDVLRDAPRPEQGRHQTASAEALRKIERLDDDLGNPPRSLSERVVMLKRCAAAAADLMTTAGVEKESQWWSRAFERGSIDQREDLIHIAAWAALPAPPPSLWREGSVDQVGRLNEFRRLLGRLDAGPALRIAARLRESATPLIDQIQSDLREQASIDHAAMDWLTLFRQSVVDSSQHALQRIKVIEGLARQCEEMAEMDFSFLYDESRNLFSIGYNVGDRRLDNSFYDLLGSEVRLGSFVAIAKGQVGQDHWFALSRMLTATGGIPALLSWSGSMFEYLMPMLVMPTYENTLLDQTFHAVVRRQIQYGRQKGVPWGISESGYNKTDAHLNYQYKAFGVPGLGLKRGLADDLVVAPYASVMALMVAPEAACQNLESLAKSGYEGAYGFYEAIDYTPSRMPPGKTSVTIRSFMAHHEGMSLLSLAYLLMDKPMQRRFDSDPMLRAADLLLQERVPKASAIVFPHATEASAARVTSSENQGAMRVITDPSAAVPDVHLLSNGQYHVVITSAGGGYSRWRDLAITRWREDATRDCWGSFIYLRDIESGAFWSTAWQPTLTPTKPYEAIFTQGRAEFRRRDGEIESHTEISVSPEDDIELRRITLINRSNVTRTIEITTYAEVVLAQRSHDLAHPAFSNLFVQTEILHEKQAIVCTRRPRSAEEKPPWMVHLTTVRGKTIGQTSFETDRMKFIGRGQTLEAPLAMQAGGPLSDSQGPVLDPVISIRHVIELAPNETARVDVVTGAAETRDAVMAMAEKYHDPNLSDRVFELAWTHSHVLLSQLNASESDAQIYNLLAGSVIYATALRRAPASLLVRNQRGQSGLWGYGISGDLPIVLLRIGDRDNIELVRQAIQAHAYWRLRGMAADLVIWNEDDSIYRQTLQDAIMALIAGSPEAALVDKPGGIFVRRGEQMSEEDRVLLQTVARIVLFDDAGTLAEQAERRGRMELPIPLLRPSLRRPETETAAEIPQHDLAFFNGLGGFTQDGREYVTILSPEQTTPAPWVNVIANPEFGTVVSEGGGAYTWSENSHEFRLTPWYNDPVSDTSGEAIYIRDEESGRFWSPSPLPARGHMPYVIRHGFGYSIFEYAEDGIISELCIYVATDAPVKFARMRIANRSGRFRRMSVTGYWEWVLGEMRSKTLLHVVTELDPVSGAIFVRNAFNTEFPGRVVFVDSSESIRTITGDRAEFLGRNGTPARPAAMRRMRLSGRVGTGMDPCAAMQVSVGLEEGQEKDIVFIIGAARSDDQARQLVHRFRGPGGAYQALEGVWHYWSQSLGTVYVETPDPAVNFLANGWLIYQTLACRMWARTGFYQSGGAFGFRDQLQDAMALVHADPGLLREHLLRAAGRQFREGDVQHWWHPPAGRGVRTHFSDDYLWLAHATCRYVAATGDTGVLDERVPFLDSRLLRPDEEANYDLPRISDDVGTLYEHCIRAINNGLRFGVHGLPLMGCGDWNDGMNLVGRDGKGESVWLGFFLYNVLIEFAALARRREDGANADKFTIEAGRLRGNIQEYAWDGQWYRRAYFDDGTPLGSSTNDECQIDSLSQSWSVLSGAGTQERSEIAMASVNRRLVRRDAKQIQLLDPPFDKSALNPGYIKGYVPGVRENGGQYTHGAIWTIMAFAELGEVGLAWELFDLINPINHGAVPRDLSIYRAEPYVVAADVYGVAPHIGRGGWTWYTGSAGWMYRLITESLLGLHLEVDKLRISPRMRPSWPMFKIHYRYRQTGYHITIHNGGGMTVARITTDDVEQSDKVITLIDDHHQHAVEVYLT